MLLLKYLMMIAGMGMYLVAATLVAYDVYMADRHRRLLGLGAADKTPTPKPIRWKAAKKLAMIAWLPLLIGLSIVVVPSGMAGVRVSQISGTRPGTLYPGMHFIKPLIERVVLFDVRDHIFTTEATETAKKAEILRVTSQEGLTIGLAVNVRYRLDARRLDYIQNNLPQPVEEEIVPPVVASAFREVVPNYTVRDVFAARREEIQKRTADEISKRLGADGIVLKEVMVRDIKLPDEYAKGLEGLLLKEQENDRLVFDTQIQEKQVRIAELQAEAEKVRAVKHAEGEAQVRVLQAKGESDAMQYTLPLKEKQIQQTRMEAEARKESTVKNAEAAAQAKVIDGKAELERRNMMADAEANRIRVTAIADGDRLKSEASVLKQNPLLINKIIAEKLSDKVQIMMVPSDGKFFLTNDLMHGVPTQPAEPEAPQEKAEARQPNEQ
ncbi:MAG TPA: SPFH domain-containing protein [Terriglobia bacterium]|nr:SPFH domain-containing protein [Terriglobia bacterium]